MTGEKTALTACCLAYRSCVILFCPVGRDVEDCRREVDISIQRLFYWGAYADKYGGQVQVRSRDYRVTVTHLCGKY